MYLLNVANMGVCPIGTSFLSREKPYF